MSNLETKILSLIATAGEAKSLCYEALSHYKDKNDALAKEKLEKADELLNEAQKIHMSLFREFERDNCDNGLMHLIVHGLDIMMTARTEYELIRILGKELYGLEDKINKILDREK